MKRFFKIVVIVIIFILLLFSIDYVSVKVLNKPFLYTDFKENENGVIYYGLLYNTSICSGKNKAIITQKKEKCCWVCEKYLFENDDTINAKIIDIKDNYLIIQTIGNSSYLNNNDEAHLSLSNNPRIVGAHNLIIGQKIQLIPTDVKETYPSIIVTTEIYIK